MSSPYHTRRMPLRIMIARHLPKTPDSRWETWVMIGDRILARGRLESLEEAVQRATDVVRRYEDRYEDTEGRPETA